MHPACFRNYIRLLGHAVAQLVEALRFNPEGRGFDSRTFYWHNPSGRTVFPEVNSASNRNEYQEYFLGVNVACA